MAALVERIKLVSHRRARLVARAATWDDRAMFCIEFFLYAVIFLIAVSLLSVLAGTIAVVGNAISSAVQNPEWRAPRHLG
jgi:hypothetical protein